MSFIRQVIALLWMNLAGIRERPGSSLTVVVGVSCAVSVLVSMLAMGAGALQTELANVHEDRALLMSTGAVGFGSNVPRDEAATARDLPGIRKDAQGRPIAVYELLIPLQARRRGTNERLFFPVIGVSSNLLTLAPEVRFTAGRMYGSGLHELIANNVCTREFTGFELGDRRDIRGIDWIIVGLFDQANDAQCSVFADVETLMSIFVRNSYTRVHVALESPSDIGRLRAAVQADPSLHLDVHTERQAVEATFNGLNQLLHFIAYFVGAIMAVGATLGAVNSLYSIVDARRRELATMRAIGFGPGVVALSILCESILLALPGAALGALAAWIFFSGLKVSPFGYNFQLEVTPQLAEIGVAWALAMGLIGGLLPALRAGRVRVTDALRAT